MNIRQERGEPEREEGLGGRVRRFVDSELNRVLDKDRDTGRVDRPVTTASADPGSTTPGYDYDAPEHETRIEEPRSERLPHQTAEDAAAERVGLLHDPTSLRFQWQQVQGTFVDDPRRAVQEASVLVNRTLDEIRENVTRGEAADPTSTEELRVSFQRYREFFHRLLSA